MHTSKFQNFVDMLSTNNYDAFQVVNALCLVLNMIALQMAILKVFRVVF